MDPRVGTDFAGYRIERVLGRGGMAVVYLAEDLRLKRRVALKVLAPQLAEDARFRERFARESQLAASLEDPNVIPIYEAGEHGDVLFIAMRYIEGTDLKSLLATEGPLPRDRVVAIVSQVASALDAAHDRGLVHRDVKPANILVRSARDTTRPEHVFLSDFGLTKRASSDSGITGTGQFVGTIDYAAPEQFEGKPLDARTDVYSLGCVLFECLTGSAPFPKEQDVARMHAHLHEAPPKVTSLRPDVTPAVDVVAAKAMAKRPEHRYARAGDLAVAVEQALGAGPGAAMRQPVIGRRALAVAGALAGAVVAGAIALLVLTGGGGATRTTGSPSASPSPTQAAAVPPRSVVEIDPRTGAVQTVARHVLGLSGPPGPPLSAVGVPLMAVGEGGVWMYTLTGIGVGDAFNHVVQIDEHSGQVKGSTAARYVLGPGRAIAVGSRTVWYTGGSSTGVFRINPATGRRLPTVSVAAGSVTDLALGGGSLWVGSSDRMLTRFDALSGRVVDRIPIGASPDALAYGKGSVWVLDRLSNQVVRADGSSGRVLSRIGVAGSLVDLAAGDEGVWLLDDVAGTVTPIDPDTNAVGAPLPVGPKPSSIAVGRGFVWVTDLADGSLYRVDPRIRDVTPFDLGAPLATVAVDPADGRVWVAVYGH
jgi:streptogramin lyase/tRNA A-37 threonylcarbamoyl transferase component Bud32